MLSKTHHVNFQIGPFASVEVVLPFVQYNNDVTCLTTWFLHTCIKVDHSTYSHHLEPVAPPCMYLITLSTEVKLVTVLHTLINVHLQYLPLPHYLVSITLLTSVLV